VAWQDFKLLGFCPDLPVTTPGTSFLMKGCYPTDVGIGGGIGFEEVSSSAANTAATGAEYVTSLSNTSEIIVGTASKLYSFDLATTLTDRSGAAYSSTDTNSWKFTTFGNIVLAANLGDQLQQRTIGAAANFASVGAAPVPKASIVVTVGPTSAPFAMVFDYTDGVNTDRDGWKSSAVSDYTGWTSGTNSCATGRLLDNVSGPITCAIPYRDGVIAWKSGGMYIGEYTGPPNIWSWRRISSDVGCIGKNAAVVADDVVYWQDQSGLWMFDGSVPRRVPGYVHAYWNKTVAALSLGDSNRHQYRTVWDKAKHIIWFLPVGHRQGLGYNTVSQLWVQALSPTIPLGYPTSTTNTLFLTDNGGTVSCAYLITGAWAMSNGKKVSSVSYTPTTFQTYYYGWALTDHKTSPAISGVRPHFISTNATSAGLGTAPTLGGFLYAHNGAYEMVPGDVTTTPIATVTMAARSPGYLDGIISANEVVTFAFVLTNKYWEIGGISLDLDRAGKP
jgi:hypothetical protein